jgi:hypothetical protein
LGFDEHAGTLGLAALDVSRASVLVSVDISNKDKACHQPTSPFALVRELVSTLLLSPVLKELLCCRVARTTYPLWKLGEKQVANPTIQA